MVNPHLKELDPANHHDRARVELARGLAHIWALHYQYPPEAVDVRYFLTASALLFATMSEYYGEGFWLQPGVAVLFGQSLPIVLDPAEACIPDSPGRDALVLICNPSVAASFVTITNQLKDPQ